MIDIKLIESPLEVIRRLFGIELNWNEKIALKYYVESVPRQDIVARFMNDYFGLSFMDLDTIPIIRVRKDKHEKRQYSIINEERGMGLLHDENFKKYCRKNVGYWRYERELI